MSVVYRMSDIPIFVFSWRFWRDGRVTLSEKKVGLGKPFKGNAALRGELSLEGGRGELNRNNDLARLKGRRK
jgi:hypothetical protein